MMSKSYYRSIRWKFSIGSRSAIIRGGIFGLELYWGAVVPLYNNVTVDERRWGLILYPIFHIVPGATVRCWSWMKRQMIEVVEQ